MSMNAHALLSAQGWRGKGHSLHATDDSIGLAKPLLLNRKDNTKGLGQRPHFTSDQWWMNAFDEQLKGLDTSTEGKVVQTVSNGRLNTIEKGAGKYMLYASFVKGGMLNGTMLEEETTDSSKASSPERIEAETKGKSAEESGKESKEERRARREARRVRKAEKKARYTTDESGTTSPMKAATSKSVKHPPETKEDRRARKEAKRQRRATKKLQSQDSG